MKNVPLLSRATHPETIMAAPAVMVPVDLSLTDARSTARKLLRTCSHSCRLVGLSDVSSLWSGSTMGVVHGFEMVRNVPSARATTSWSVRSTAQMSRGLAMLVQPLKVSMGICRLRDDEGVQSTTSPTLPTASWLGLIHLRAVVVLALESMERSTSTLMEPSCATVMRSSLMCPHGPPNASCIDWVTASGDVLALTPAILPC